MKIVTKDELFFNSVIDRLKITTKSKTLTSLAELLGLTSGAFANYKKRNSVPFDRVITLCESQNVSLDWIFTGKYPRNKPDLYGHINDQAEKRYDFSVMKENNDFSLVPFYDVEASAGSGSLIDQELKSGDMAFRNDWLMSKGLNAGQCALIKARGDSMEPTICDGDLLLIDMRVNEIQDDSIYILQVDHHLIVKRVQQSLNSTILIISDNKRYETQTLTADYSKELKVVGRLRWYGHEI